MAAPLFFLLQIGAQIATFRRNVRKAENITFCQIDAQKKLPPIDTAAPLFLLLQKPLYITRRVAGRCPRRPGLP